MAEPTNTPMPGSTPRSTSPALLSSLTLQTPASPLSPTKLSTLPKARILHLGEPLMHAGGVYEDIQTQTEVIRPSADELQGCGLIKALRDRTWGDFQVVLWTPDQEEQEEMGNWDWDMIKMLPRSVKLFATPGSVTDVDVDALGERNIMFYGGSEEASEKSSEEVEKKQQESCLEYVVAMLVMSHMMTTSSTNT